MWKDYLVRHDNTNCQPGDNAGSECDLIEEVGKCEYNYFSKKTKQKEK